MPSSTDPPRGPALTIAERIEELFGQPLAELEALAADAPHRTLLGALTHGQSELALAERSIAFHLERLHELTSPEREIGRFESGHIFDCARRIADSVATRDAYAVSIGAVLSGLRRVSGPNATPVASPGPAVPVAAAPSRTR